MAEKAASVKLGLKNKGFVDGLKDAKNKGTAEAQALGRSFSQHLSAGMRGGLASVKQGFSSLKTFVAGLGLFAGLPGLKDQVMHAVQMEGKYRHLAFAIRAGTGEAVRWQSIQKAIGDTAVQWGQDTDDLLGTYKELFEATGDAKFAEASMKSIGMAATATGESIQDLTGLTGVLNENFGLTADEVPDALAQIFALSKQGGVGFGDLAAKLGVVGSSATAAGLDGKEGLSKILAMLNLTDGKTKNFKAGLKAVSDLVETLGNKTTRAKPLAQLGITGNVKGDVTDVIGQILQKTKGQKGQLEKAFGGEQLKFLVGLGDTYSKAFESTQGDVKTKTAAALAAYNEALTQAGKSTMTGADLQKQAAEEMLSPEKQMASSLARIEQAFARPEITAAVTKLAKHLPALAEAAAQAIGWIADNPMAAGGLAVGGLFAKGAMTEGIMGAFSSGGTSAASAIAKAVAGSAPGFASGLAPLMGPIGLALGASLGIMLAASIADAKRDQEKRTAQAKEAAQVLDADRQRAQEALRQQGIETSPFAGLDKKSAGQMTANQDERDNLELAMAMERARQQKADLAMGNKLANKHGFAGPGELAASGAGPNASVDANAGRGPQRAVPASNTVDQLVGKVLQVNVINAKDIGGNTTGVQTTLAPGYIPKGG